MKEKSAGKQWRRDIMRAAFKDRNQDAVVYLIDV